MRSFARVGVLLAVLGHVLGGVPSAQAPSPDQQLLAAVAAGDVARATALIAQGADVNADNGHGGTPLYTAADLANVPLVKLLLEHGANPSTPDLEYGRTPLKNAIVPWSDVKDSEARALIVRLLIDKGAGSEGAELVDLIRRGWADAAKTIIDRGQATFSALNLALAEAKRSQKTELADLLVKAGAKEPTPIDSHTSPARVKLVSGVYRSAAGQSVTLVPSVRGDELVLERSDGVRALVVPTDLTTFRSLDMQVVMRLQGRSLPPSEIHLRTRGQRDVFARVGDAPTAPSAATPTSPAAAAAPSSATSRPAVTIPRPKAGEWPSFRGVHAAGVADGAHPPSEWDAGKGTNIKWKTPIPGFSHSSPIVWGDRVFVTTVESLDPSPLTFLHGGDFQAGSVVAAANDREPHAWRIYALDRNTGKVLWQRTPFEGTPRTARHVMQSHADATPATDGTHLVVSFGSQGLYCYDLDGKVLWKRDLGPLRSAYVVDPTFEWSTSSSPIIYRNLVFLQADLAKDSFLTALDIRSGKDVWRIPRDETPSWATPLLYESPKGDVLITAATKYVRAYDPMTGRELWRLGNHSTYVTPTPVGAGDVIYFTSGSGGTIQPIYAVRAAARGDVTLKDNEVSNESVLWSWNRGGSFIPTPVVYDGILYVSSTNGVLSAYDIQTGKRLYQDRLTRGGSYSASGVAADGRLYYASEDGDVIVVKAGPTFERLAQNPMGEVIMATPAITQGMMIIRTQHNVVAVADGAAAR